MLFRSLEQAAFPGPFERVFGTPHGARMAELAAAAGLPYRRIERSADLPVALHAAGSRGSGICLVELRTDRPGQAALRLRLAGAAAAALS